MARSGLLKSSTFSGRTWLPVISSCAVSPASDCYDRQAAVQQHQTSLALMRRAEAFCSSERVWPYASRKTNNLHETLAQHAHQTQLCVWFLLPSNMQLHWDEQTVEL